MELLVVQIFLSTELLYDPSELSRFTPPLPLPTPSKFTANEF